MILTLTMVLAHTPSTAVGRGKECPLCDPMVDLSYEREGGSWTSMESKKKKKIFILTLAVTLAYSWLKFIGAPPQC